MPTAQQKDIPIRRINIPLTGYLLTSPSTVETGRNYRILRNMRYGINSHPQAIGGMTKVNTTSLSVYTNVRGAINFAKNQPEVENHILVQAWNGGLTSSQVFDNLATVPNQGNYGSALWTDKAGAKLGRFALTPAGDCIYCNGLETCIYGGTESRIGGFVAYNSTVGKYIDYFYQMSSTMKDDHDLFPFNFNGLFYVGSLRPIKGFELYSYTANTVASVMTVNYWNGSVWVPVNNLSDGTSTAGVSMAKTGFVTFDDTYAYAKSTQLMNKILYWYQVTFTNVPLNGTLYYSTLLYNFQPLMQDNWDGVLRLIVDFEVSSTDYTLNVSAIDYNSGFNSTFAELGSGTGATAVATISGGLVIAITITSGGVGYSYPPQITISGGGGSGATATATILNGGISSITITAPGSAYTSTPQITIAEGGGFNTGQYMYVACLERLQGIAVYMGGNSVNYASSSMNVSYWNGNSWIPVSGLTDTTQAAAGAISAVNKTAGGSGYVSAPLVSFVGGGGVGATATCTLAGDAVNTITVTNGGNGYSSAPSVVFTPTNGGSGATATAVIAGGITGVLITNTGSGYSAPPAVGFAGGGGANAAGTAILGVGSITVTNPGSGYTSVPNVSITGGSGSGATGSALLSPTSVASLTLNNGGSGYTSITGISLTGGGGSNATATYNSGVASITVTDVGNYGGPGAPTVNFSGGGGTGAAGTANMAFSGFFWFVGSVTITNAGNGYTTQPAISFTGGSVNSPAQGTAYLKVLSVTLTAGGSGYSSQPLVVFASSGGSGASATANMAGTSIASISVTNGGSGYTSPPSVSITAGGGINGAATAIIGVVSVNMTNPGSGYTSLPTVSFTGAHTVLATGTAIFSSGTLGQTGFITWTPPNLADEQKTIQFGKVSAYYYQLSVSATLSPDVRIDYLGGIPAPSDIESYSFAIQSHDRVFLCDEYNGDRNSARYSAIGTSTIFNGVDSGYLYFGDALPLTAACPMFAQFSSAIFNMTVFCKQHQTWILAGDTPRNWQTYRISGGIGCASPNTMIGITIGTETISGQNNNLVVWQGAQGVYTFDGRNINPIHLDIDDWLDQRNTYAINPNMISNSVAFYDELWQEYHWLFASGTSTTLNKEFVFSFRKKHWYEINRGTGAYLQFGITALNPTGLNYNYGFIDTGYTERLEYGTTFDGNSIKCEIQTGDILPFDDFMIDSEVRRIRLFSVAKKITTNQVQGSYFIDSDSVAKQTFTMSANARITTFGIANQHASGEPRGGLMHGFYFSLTTTDEPIGFEPIAVGLLVRATRDEF